MKRILCLLFACTLLCGCNNKNHNITFNKYSNAGTAELFDLSKDSRYNDVDDWISEKYPDYDFIRVGAHTYGPDSGNHGYLYVDVLDEERVYECYYATIPDIGYIITATNHVMNSDDIGSFTDTYEESSEYANQITEIKAILPDKSLIASNLHDDDNLIFIFTTAKIEETDTVELLRQIREIVDNPYLRVNLYSSLTENDYNSLCETEYYIKTDNWEHMFLPFGNIYSDTLKFQDNYTFNNLYETDLELSEKSE